MILAARGGSVLKPNPYIASAVQFDGTAFLQNDSLSCTDDAVAGSLSFSVWMKATGAGYGNSFAFLAGTTSNNTFTPTSSTGVMQFYIHDTTKPAISNFLLATTVLLPAANSAWQHFLMSAETNFAPISLYFNYVCASDDGQTLFGAIWAGKWYKSTDYGATWAAVSASSVQTWFAISCSSDANTVISGNQNSLVTFTGNGGTSVSTNSSIGTGGCNAVSSDGTKLISGPGTGHFESGFAFISTNSGSSFSQLTSAGSRAWTEFKFAKNNSNIIVGLAYDDYIYISTDGGANWTTQTAAGQLKWQRVALSDDGQTIYVTTLAGKVWKTANGGTSWAELTTLPTSDFSGIDCSANGSIVLVGASTDGDAQATSAKGLVYLSTDGGVSFNGVTALGYGLWNCTTVSADGTKMTALSNSIGFWYSTDSGATWTRAVYNSPSKRIKIYVNDIDKTDVVSDVWPAFIPSMNGLALAIGTNVIGGSSQYNGSMADFWLAPGVSLLDIDGDIPVATRRKFIAAEIKPVDPRYFPAGGAVLHTGDASAFATNRLPGGAFTLTGALTNAATHP